MKSKVLLPGRVGDEKAELNESSDSDRLRLRTIFTRVKTGAEVMQPSEAAGKIKDKNRVCALDALVYCR